MSIIELTNLTKEYRRLGGSPVAAVDNLSLLIDSPGVHGFLGPNGSGKTTTIRCLLSLIAPTKGQTRIFGVDTTTQLHTVISRVGALVESPKFFPNFTAHKNLDLLARVGGATSSDVERALETVGLRARGNDRFKSYSLGMKQRLAVAATLLKNPDLIILDEPANGLDPQGIKEMRDLVQALGADGRAVFISSHQLSEIQQVCDTVTIIQNGRLVTSGAVDAIVDQASGGGSVVVTIDDPTAAIAALSAAGVSGNPGATNDTVRVNIDPAASADVTRILANAGLYLRAMSTEALSLEEAFLTLTGDARPDGSSPTHQEPPPGPPPGPPGPPVPRMPRMQPGTQPPTADNPVLYPTVNGEVQA